MFQRKEDERGEDEEEGVTWSSTMVEENAIFRGWTSVIYSRRTPEAAASPRELRNLPRTRHLAARKYFHRRGTELKIPSPSSKSGTRQFGKIFKLFDE